MESSTLILGAMDSEIDYLVSKLENCNESKLDNYSVYEGKIGDAWVWAKWWEAWNRHLYKGL